MLASTAWLSAQQYPQTGSETLARARQQYKAASKARMDAIG
jgi:hypothetical protein